MKKEQQTLYALRDKRNLELADLISKLGRITESLGEAQVPVPITFDKNDLSLQRIEHFKAQIEELENEKVHRFVLLVNG